MIITKKQNIIIRYIIIFITLISLFLFFSFGEKIFASFDTERYKVKVTSEGYTALQKVDQKFLVFDYGKWKNHISGVIKERIRNKEICKFSKKTLVNSGINTFHLVNDSDLLLKFYYTTDMQDEISECIRSVKEIVNGVNKELKELINHNISREEIKSLVYNFRNKIGGDESSTLNTKINRRLDELTKERFNFEKKIIQSTNFFEIIHMGTTSGTQDKLRLKILFIIFMTSFFLLFVLNFIYKKKINITKLF
jgi:hypothetical protein